MDVPADSRVNSLSKQRIVLLVLLVVSVIGNVIWIMKASSPPPKPVVKTKKEDIEVRGTVSRTRDAYYGSDPYEFEGTITNTSKADASEVKIKAMYWAFQVKEGDMMEPSDYFQVLDTFRNLKAGETRSFHLFAPKIIEKKLLTQSTYKMRTYGDDYVVPAQPKLDWEIK